MMRPVTLASLGEIMCPHCGAMDLALRSVVTSASGGVTVVLHCSDCERDDLMLMLVRGSLAWRVLE